MKPQYVEAINRIVREDFYSGGQYVNPYRSGTDAYAVYAALSKKLYQDNGAIWRKAVQNEAAL